MPTDLFTTSYLGSYAGLVAATYLLVQFFKEPIRQHLNDWWVRVLAVVIAAVIQGFVLYVGNNLTVESIGLAVMNAFLVAITAAGAHEISRPSTAPTTPSVPLQGINVANHSSTGQKPAETPVVPEVTG